MLERFEDSLESGDLGWAKFDADGASRVRGLALHPDLGDYSTVIAGLRLRPRRWILGELRLPGSICASATKFFLHESSGATLRCIPRFGTTDNALKLATNRSHVWSGASEPALSRVDLATLTATSCRAISYITSVASFDRTDFSNPVARMLPPRGPRGQILQHPCRCGST